MVIFLKTNLIGSSAKIEGLISETYGTGVELTGDLEPMERGNTLHRCFEVMGSEDVSIDELSKVAGYDFSDAEYQGVRKSVSDFNSWITNRFFPMSVQRELPILALNDRVNVKKLV